MIYIIILKVSVVKFEELCKTIYMINRGFSLHGITFLRREAIYELKLGRVMTQMDNKKLRH
jgi:hypothetical protein